MADHSHITDKAVTAPNPALVDAVHQALKPEAIRAALVEFWGDDRGVNIDLCEVLEGGILDSVMKRVEPLFAALPVLDTTTDSEAAPPVAGQLPAMDEFEGFFIANDDGYPELRYSDSDDGNDEGEFVEHVDAGTFLPDIVRAARQHTASLRGEQG